MSYYYFLANVTIQWVARLPLRLIYMLIGSLSNVSTSIRALEFAQYQEWSSIAYRHITSPQHRYLLQELEEWGLILQDRDVFGDVSTLTWAANNAWTSKALFDLYAPILRKNDALTIIYFCDSRGELTNTDRIGLKTDPQHPVYSEVNARLRYDRELPLDLGTIYVAREKLATDAA